MSGTSTPKNSLSVAERLKATDTSLEKMRSILKSMDEIDELRTQNGEPIVDEYDGYKRSAVEKLTSDLEKQRESIFEEIGYLEKNNAGGELAKTSEAGVPDLRKMDPLTGYRHGDMSLAIESVYLSIAMDIEKMRDDILQEMKYTYKQDMAIYDDISSMIESLRKESQPDWDDFARKVASEINAETIDYNSIADKVAARFVEKGIDYDTLAERIRTRARTRTRTRARTRRIARCERIGCGRQSAHAHPSPRSVRQG